MEDMRLTVTLNPMLPDDSIGQRQVVLKDSVYRVVLGRSSKSEVKRLFADKNNFWFDNRVVSRAHAELTAVPLLQEVYLTDTESMHGTCVNGMKLPCRQKRMLMNDDIITLGSEITRGDDFFGPLEVQVKMEWNKDCDREMSYSPPSGYVMNSSTVPFGPVSDHEDVPDELSSEDEETSSSESDAASSHFTNPSAQASSAISSPNSKNNERPETKEEQLSPTGDKATEVWKSSLSLFVNDDEVSQKNNLLDEPENSLHSPHTNDRTVPDSMPEHEPRPSPVAAANLTIKDVQAYKGSLYNDTSSHPEHASDNEKVPGTPKPIRPPSSVGSGTSPEVQSKSPTTDNQNVHAVPPRLAMNLEPIIPDQTSKRNLPDLLPESPFRKPFQPCDVRNYSVRPEEVQQWSSSINRTDYTPTQTPMFFPHMAIPNISDGTRPSVIENGALPSHYPSFGERNWTCGSDHRSSPYTDGPFALEASDDEFPRNPTPSDLDSTQLRPDDLGIAHLPAPQIRVWGLNPSDVEMEHTLRRPTDDGPKFVSEPLPPRVNELSAILNPVTDHESDDQASLSKENTQNPIRIPDRSGKGLKRRVDEIYEHVTDNSKSCSIDSEPLPDTQPQETIPEVFETLPSKASLITPNESGPPMVTAVNEPPQKRAKTSHSAPSRTGSLARYVATAVVGATFGGIGAVMALASLPPNYFD